MKIYDVYVKRLTGHKEAESAGASITERKRQHHDTVKLTKQILMISLSAGLVHLVLFYCTLFLHTRINVKRQVIFVEMISININNYKKRICF